MNSYFTLPPMPIAVKIIGGIINTHTHPRDIEADGDGRTECFVPYYNGIYSDIIGIGNTVVPMTTCERGLVQKAKWQQHTTTRVHCAGLMTEDTDPDDVIAAYDRPAEEQVFIAMKAFIRAVSNSNGHDVNDIHKIIPTIRAMNDVSRFRHRKTPMVTKLHCERKWTPLGLRIPVVERETAALRRDIETILTEVPEAHLEICHVSDGATIEAIDHYRSRGFNVCGEIAPHYGLYCTDDLYEDGNGGTALNSHRFCLPAFKSVKDKMIILGAMTSGKPWYYFGNDEACHHDDPTQEKGVKTNRRGITLGGQTQIPEAIISFVIEEFAKAGRLNYLSAFLNQNARTFYGLPASNDIIMFERKSWIIPNTIEKVLEKKTITCSVAMGGQERLFAKAA